MRAERGKKGLSGLDNCRETVTFAVEIEKDSAAVRKDFVSG
jgi:hypothetical protein